MPRKHVHFGWLPDLPDHRDQHYEAPKHHVRRPPKHVDLRPQCPPVYVQGKLGSCTANAIAAAIEFDQMKQGLSHVFTPSRLFIYYNERVMERRVEVDSGAQIREGIKSVGRRGVCPEKMWPYDIVKFRHKPPKRCYQVALHHRAVAYQRVPQTLPQLKGCLAHGYPFLFGIAAYASIKSPHVKKTGHLDLPQRHEDVLGGHAMLAVGYDDHREIFIVRNSWGTRWGLRGYCTMPYPYVLNHHLSEDFWTIRVVQ